MVYYITKTHLNFALLHLAKGVEALPLVTLQTQFIHNIGEYLEQCNGVIFTSKNAIYAFDENLQSLKQGSALKAYWKRLPNFVIGQGSANALKALGLKADFIASSAYGEVFAQELVPLLKGRKPLFVRAKKISSGLPQILRDKGIALQEVVVYENVAHRLNNPPQLQQNSIILFSAPSHIEAFLLNFTWDCSFYALCLGASTKKAAQKLLKTAKILQAPTPNIELALAFALDFETTLNKG